MDEAVMRGARLVLAGSFLVAAALPSSAQSLADPTRPPDATGAPVAGEGGRSGPALQTIVVSPGRRIAVIDGRAVKVGDRVGEARVVAIDFDSVRLRTGAEVTVIKLLPDVQKTTSRAAGTPDSQKAKRR